MIVSYIIGIGFLLMVLNIMARRFPFVINPLKKWSVWLLKIMTRVLWKKPERGGGARATPPRIRYRE